ncbi:GreA/GreB family elongation factor [Bizionia myxarmorum]|uniref:Transcription elongation factor n=1 Tax=Bizionia myxarmorum TaxID=291186 RepID=A0A5D0R5U9_9FLAO|nr:transcription elongation factor [Bizionia myxarmorum]TYB76266.1 transcription elongation factor [Bizionia myxarmorum]
MNEKEVLLQACFSYVNKRIASYKGEIDTIKESIEANDKSNDMDDDSGNGKLFNDLEKNAQHLSEATKTLDTLKLINPKKKSEGVSLGSIVKTSKNTFFMAISIGAIDTEENNYFGISLLSPIGQLLKGKMVGDTITFNENTHEILEIK